MKNGNKIGPLQDWKLLKWQKSQCTGCEICVERPHCLSLRNKARILRFGGVVDGHRITKSEWAIFERWQNICADLGHDCVDCGLTPECNRLRNWMGDISRLFEVGVIFTAQHSSGNPCVENYCVTLPHGKKLRPLKMSDCQGFSAVGTGNYRIKG